MIVQLNGKLIEIHPGTAVLECAGVGYGISIPLSVYEQLQHKAGQNVLLYTHHRLREQGMDLYGFIEKSSRSLFTTLLSINGVGPALALSLLSWHNADSLLQIVKADQEKELVKINGVGPAKAKKILFELNGRLKKLEKLTNRMADKVEVEPGQNLRDDAIFALHQNLGFDLLKSRDMVDQIMKQDPEQSLEKILKTAIRELK